MKHLTVAMFAGVLLFGLMGCEDGGKKPAAKGGTGSCGGTKCAAGEKCGGSKCAAGKTGKKCPNCPDGSKCDSKTCGTAAKCEKCPEGKCECKKETAAPAAKPATKPGACCPGH